MGLRQTYNKNHEQIHELLGVPSDEPIFILRAQDKFSVPTIYRYKDIAHNGTPIGDESEKWVAELELFITDFVIWQRNNRDKVKVPD